MGRDHETCSVRLQRDDCHAGARLLLTNSFSLIFSSEIAKKWDWNLLCKVFICSLGEKIEILIQNFHVEPEFHFLFKLFLHGNAVLRRLPAERVNACIEVWFNHDGGASHMKRTDFIRTTKATSAPRGYCDISGKKSKWKIE